LTQILGQPCGFQVEGSEGGGSSEQSGGESGEKCPQGRPYRCVMGDANNDTTRCVAASLAVGGRLP
jgi:hypothetical protein